MRELVVAVAGIVLGAFLNVMARRFFATRSAPHKKGKHYARQKRSTRTDRKPRSPPRLQLPCRTGAVGLGCLLQSARLPSRPTADDPLDMEKPPRGGGAVPFWGVLEERRLEGREVFHRQQP